MSRNAGDDNKRAGKRPRVPDSNSNIENVTNAYVLARQQGITLDAARRQLLQQAGTSRRHAALAREVLELPDMVYELSKQLGISNMASLRGTSKGVRRAVKNAIWTDIVGGADQGATAEPTQGPTGTEIAKRTRPPTSKERARHGIPAEVTRVVVHIPARTTYAPPHSTHMPHGRTQWHVVPGVKSSRASLLQFVLQLVSSLHCHKERQRRLEQLYWGLVMRDATAIAAEVRRFNDWWSTWCQVLPARDRQRKAGRIEMNNVLASLSDTTLAFLAYMLSESSHHSVRRRL
jgi:hypothetical protein